MSTPKELVRARERLAEAQESLDAISALPRRKGSVVIWSNGVVWVRQKDDDWVQADAPTNEWHWHTQSEHVASGRIVAVHEAPSAAAEKAVADKIAETEARMEWARKALEVVSS